VAVRAGGLRRAIYLEGGGPNFCGRVMSFKGEQGDGRTADETKPILDGMGGGGGVRLHVQQVVLGKM